VEIEKDRYMENIINTFIECPRVIFLAKLIGGLNLAALMVTENDVVLKCISTVCLIRIIKGIRRSEA